MKKIALHCQIIIGLILGVLFGIVAATNQWGQFTADWITPFGTIFVTSAQAGCGTADYWRL